MKNTKRDVNSMIRDLEIETVILQNTCEGLLIGIASSSEIEDMIKNPFGDAWKKYNDEVRLRMWSSGQSFQDRVEDMLKATAELHARLALDDEGKTRLNDRASILTELKRKTSFTLRKDQYASILARLHNGNAVLSVLAKQNSELEPTRRSRSQAKAARLIRRLSAGIFSAFYGAMGCSCVGSHDLGLVIATRKPVILPGDKEEEAARALHFDIVLGTHGEKLQRWDRMRVKLAEKEVSPPVSTSPPTQSKPPRKRSRLASSLSARSSNVLSNPWSSKTPASSPTHPTSNPVSPRSQITNLCQILRKGKRLPSDCYGFISGRSREFGLYHQDCPSSCSSTITLREILEGEEKDIINFGYLARLKLALTLSFSVLHLYNTPWLSKVITLDDIVFLRWQDTVGNQTYDVDCPFLAKQVPDASQQSQTALMESGPSHLTTLQQPIPATMDRLIDSTLLSLGLLLIQIIVGAYSEQLHIEDGMTVDCILEKQTLAFNMAGLVVEKGGRNYSGAVQWCLENFLAVATLDNEDLAERFYASVVSRLEDDMKHQTTTDFT